MRFQFNVYMRHAQMQDAKAHKPLNEFVITTSILLTSKYILHYNPENAFLIFRQSGEDFLLSTILICIYNCTFHKQ